MEKIPLLVSLPKVQFVVNWMPRHPAKRVVRQAHHERG